MQKHEVYRKKIFIQMGNISMEIKMKINSNSFKLRSIFFKFRLTCLKPKITLNQLFEKAIKPRPLTIIKKINAAGVEI